MSLILTSDFPSSANDTVTDRLRKGSGAGRIAWMPPFTAMGRERFLTAQGVFRALSCPTIEYCDIDQEPSDSQLAGLDQYDVIYLSGGRDLAAPQSPRRAVSGQGPELLRARAE